MKFQISKKYTLFLATAGILLASGRYMVNSVIKESNKKIKTANEYLERAKSPENSSSNLVRILNNSPRMNDSSRYILRR
ncbi:hypothetical protein COU54_02710 [Candidatus Pacearchaeota archaeon CG10_big_fil_rev_8_21_14_0_10_31_24]|nr:MAG: hypothetical protein COU54_02710 [Candidatus Pacearchaeota archaeon CG10_big_fil_rev_8_21_14_0_10_31_24]